MPPLAILDIDGTLVDTNYHHAISWYRAFRQQGVTLPLWQIHQRMGMGGDQLVADLAGDEVEDELGDDIRTAEGPLYKELMPEVSPIPGARELIVGVDDRGHEIILASSAKQHEVDHYLDLLDARELADAWTSSADVETTKPAPDLVEVALERSKGQGDAVLVGDSTWDCQAAERAGIESVGVLTGGFSREELYEAGAAVVFRSLQELVRRIEETPLARLS
ncbi:MAG: HAD family hydrolase [Thermoleophilaceae bacterium]|nr:HAD family hydrolase [Thermoleophilaceae bacterium]